MFFTFLHQFIVCVELAVRQQEAEAGVRQIGQAVCVDGDLHVSKQHLGLDAAGVAQFLLQLGEPLQDELVFSASHQTSEVQDSYQVLPAAGCEEQNRPDTDKVHAFSSLNNLTWLHADFTSMSVFWNRLLWQQRPTEIKV